MKPSILNISWQQINNLIDKFIKKARSWGHDYNNYDIIAIGRGGLIPAQLLAYGLNVPRVHSLGLSYYEKDVIGGKRKMPVFYQGITTTLNNNVLIIDDITDTGSTVDHAIDYLKLITGRTNFITYSLFTKSHVAFKVNYYGQKVDDDTWVRFPWDK